MKARAPQNIIKNLIGFRTDHRLSLSICVCIWKPCPFKAGMEIYKLYILWYLSMMMTMSANFGANL